MISPPELILDAKADLGEGPAWEPETACLYWVDIHAGRLHTFNPGDGSDRSIELGEYLGCAAPAVKAGWCWACAAVLPLWSFLQISWFVSSTRAAATGNRFQ